MKKIEIIALFLLGIFLMQISATGFTDIEIEPVMGVDNIVISSDTINYPSELLQFYNDNMTINVYNQDKVVEGYTLFNIEFGKAYFGSKIQSVAVVDMDGNIISGLPYINKEDAEMINSTTLMYSANSTHIGFWNLFTNATEYFPIPEGRSLHHDWEYNPISETFLVLGRETTIDGVELAGELVNVIADSFYEMDKSGNVLWSLNSSDFVPFDVTEYYTYNFTKKANADWTHGNAVFWDYEENVFYYNARCRDSIYKINIETLECEWTLGRYNGNFTMFDKNGNEKVSLFYAAHSIEKLNDTHFIIYDNDYYNETNIINDEPNYLIFEIDEDTMEAREVWRWIAPSDYPGATMGDADRLPNGNVLGTYHGGVTYLTEVNKAGEIVWELFVNGTDVYRAERFYDSPLIQFTNTTYDAVKKENATLTFSVWNSFKERRSSPGSIAVFDGETLLLDYNFNFKPYWQETELSIEIPTEEYKKGTYNLTVIIENADGISTSTTIFLSVERASAPAIIIGLSSIFLVAVLAKKKRKYK